MALKFSEGASPIGNIWGWKYSFISLGIILVTLLAVVVFDEHPDVKKRRMEQQLKSDTVQVDSLERREE